MPIEHREISFSVKEVEEIFRSYADLVGMILPSGALISMLMTSTNHGRQSYIMLTFRKGEEKVIHEVPLRFASKCLMSYCKDHDVPLPMNSNKFLCTSENRLMFRVRMPGTKTDSATSHATATRTKSNNQR